MPHITYHYSFEHSGMDIHGSRAVKDIVEGIHLIESEAPLSPEREQAFEGLRLKNEQLVTEPEQMRSIYVTIDGEYQLVKAGLHRLLVDLRPKSRKSARPNGCQKRATKITCF